MQGFYADDVRGGIDLPDNTLMKESVSPFLQLIAVVCIGLLDDPANNSRIRVFVAQRTIMLAYTTFGGFIIICGVYLMGRGVRDA